MITWNMLHCAAPYAIMAPQKPTLNAIASNEALCSQITRIWDTTIA